MYPSVFELLVSWPQIFSTSGVFMCATVLDDPHGHSLVCNCITWRTIYNDYDNMPDLQCYSGQDWPETETRWEGGEHFHNRTFTKNLLLLHDGGWLFRSPKTSVRFWLLAVLPSEDADWCVISLIWRECTKLACTVIFRPMRVVQWDRN